MYFDAIWRNQFLRLEKKAAKADETVDSDWRRSPFRKITTTDLLDNSDLEKFILIKPLILAEGKKSLSAIVGVTTYFSFDPIFKVPDIDRDVLLRYPLIE